MQAKATTSGIGPMRVIGIMVSGSIAVLLMVGLVIGSLGLGSEGRAGQGPIKQPTTIVRSN
jgi:O-antigen ligase